MQRLVHIGYPKTGTTSLQYIFANHSQVSHAGKPKGQRGDNGVKDVELMRCLLGATDDEFAARYAELSKEVQNVNVLSDEQITFFPHTRRPDRWNIPRKNYHRKTVCGRLDSLLSQPIFLIVVRDQLSFIKSDYIQRCKNRKMPRFRTHVQELLDKGAENGTSFLSYLKYDEVLKDLLQVCSSERVYVAFYTDVCSNWDGFVSDIFRLLNLNIEEALALGQYHQLNPAGSIFWCRMGIGRLALGHTFFRRIYNCFMNNSGLKPFINFANGLELRYTKRQQAELKSIFAGSNQKFKDMLDAPTEGFNVLGMAKFDTKAEGDL